MAALLTAIALAVPCVAWYIVGSREAEREAARLESEPLALARSTAEQLAERLTARLDALRDAEEKRPFYQYQNFYHDPNGAYEGASVIPSPLAQGPADPLIRAHFQIDATGQVTLPTLSDDFAANGVQQELAPQQIDEQRRVLRDLQPANKDVVSVAESDQTAQGLSTQPPATSGYFADSTPPQTAAPSEPPVQQSQAASSFPVQQPATQSASRSQLKPRASKTEELDPSAWAQNAAAPSIYNYLRTGKTVAKEQFNLPQSKASQGNVQIRVGPFQWTTLKLGQRPVLAALRTVATPEGRRVQGFLISNESIADSLKGAAYSVECRPGEPVHRPDSSSIASGMYLGREAVPQLIAASVADTGWMISVNSGRAIAEAAARAAKVRAAFYGTFFGGVTAASIAGMCVVGLVWQTERFARQRSQFAASAAHELRTPLAGLRMYSEMLAEGLGDPTRAKDYARRVADEAERLGRVVANVLGFTRLERGTLQVRPEPGDLAAAVRECVERQRPALEAAGAHVEVSIAEVLPPVKFDRDAVAEIVQNLLDNAEKHARAATDRTIRVSVASSMIGLAVAIADRGPGISTAVQRRLFRPFARGENFDAPAGLGLGLVLVQGLVHAHGGKIAYSDAPGGGAVFTVTFPC